MMKGDHFEVHHGALDLIQPNEVIQWDCTPMGFQIPRPVNLAENYVPGPDFSDFMENVVRHISSDHASPDSSTAVAEVFSVNNNFSPPFAQQHLHNQQQDISNNTTNTKSEDPSLTMISLILECAVSISVDNLVDANRILSELTQLASPYSSSCAERVVAHFAKAMNNRLMSSWLAIYLPLVPHKTILASFQAFNNISPFIKFSHFTANQAILEAFQHQNRVHIIDVDIMQGLQWPALFHILATRPDGPPHVRMMGLGSSMEALQETGKQLSNFAKRLGMPFEFQPIAKRFGDLDPAMVQSNQGEAVAVHWLQHSLYDPTGSDRNTIRLLEAMNPKVITLVEQELVHSGSFLDRFVGSLHYYSTLFDSLGASLPIDEPSRLRVETGLLAREISNILAVGGPARSGEEKFVRWRTELGRRLGFAQVAMSSNAMAQAQLIVNMFPPSLGYTIMQGDGTLRLGWKDTGLYTASAWTSTMMGK